MPSVLSRWSVTFYGYVDLDTMWDSLQGPSDLLGNVTLPRAGTYAASHDQFTMSIRNSRLGFRIGAPDLGWLKASAVVEVDFVGNQPSPITEAAFFNNPGLRLRLAYFNAQTPIVDVLIGQNWALFGWQSYFFPASVAMQGLPGQVFERTAQVRVSRALHFSPDLGMEFAIAAVRPPQRAGGLPDGQAGLRLLVPARKAYRTVAAVQPTVDAMALGVSGVLRRFAVPAFQPNAATDVTATGWGVSVDVLLPIIAASTTSHDNALTFTGSYVRGAGTADLYQSLSGPAFPSLPNPGNITPPPTYSASIDQGLVGFDSAGNLHPVSWQSFMLGLQYSFPGSTGLWVSANYSHLQSFNATELAHGSRTVFVKEQYASGALLWDAAKPLRVGLEFAWLKQDFINPGPSVNRRVQLSGWYYF
jgi:hypothetical protein